MTNSFRRQETSSDQPNRRLTNRDAEIIAAVHQYRALTTEQLERLFFPPSPLRREASPKHTAHDAPSRSCQRRLAYLTQAGFLTREELPTRRTEGRRPYVYFLGTLGAEYLIESGLIARQAFSWNSKHNLISPLHLNHLLALSEVRLSVTISVRNSSELKVGAWYTEAELKRRKMCDEVTIIYPLELTGDRGVTQTFRLIPDAYFTILNGPEMKHFFVEADRGTEAIYKPSQPGHDWVSKVLAYLEYYFSGRFRHRYGGETFRLLTVTTTEARLTSMIEATYAVGGEAKFWFTTWELLRDHNMLTDPIWRVPGTGETFHALYEKEAQHPSAR